MAEKSKLKIAYHIKHEEGREKPFFNRIGRAFTNKNGSINLLLDYLPLPTVKKDGTVYEVVINIQDYQPKEKTDGDSFSE
jgi:hypothetical protein